MPATRDLDALFGAQARRLRRRLAARYLLAGVTAGLSLGALATAVFYWQRLGELRLYPLLAALFGCAAGLALARTRRWSDTDVALYLDSKLRSHEAISTYVGQRGSAPGPASELVRRHAETALARANTPELRPRTVRPWHALAPLAAAAMVWLNIAPLPAAPDASAGQGVMLARPLDLTELSPLEALDKLDARDADQKRRLRAIAERARALREKLKEGASKELALAELAELRDAIAAERLALSPSERQGLEALLRELGRHPGLGKAKAALGDGDLTAFDEAMSEVANRAEQEDRDRAKEALAAGEEAARRAGARELAETMAEQRRLFEERVARAQAVRELAGALRGQLDAEGREALQRFSDTGSRDAERRLLESMEKALQGMSEEERKRLAEALRSELGSSTGKASPLTREELEQLAKSLESPEGQERLAEQLRALAEGRASPRCERDGALRDAERSGADAQRRLNEGVIPLPTPASPSGSRGGQPQSGNDGTGRGGTRDEGTGDHAGESAPVPGDELRAKANPRLNPAAPLHGAVQGRAPGRAGETANRLGSGRLGEVAPDEVGAAERSRVPEEYREQVGRYFQP
jgi:hypothetical protein